MFGVTKSLFYLKNENSDNLMSTWFLGLVPFGLLGGVFSGGVALTVAQDEMRDILLWYALIFPCLAVLSFLIQAVLGMRHYFIPTLINQTISIWLSLVLTILFNLIALYSLLPFYAWVIVTLLVLFFHSLMWYYNTLRYDLMVESMLENHAAGNLAIGAYTLDSTTTHEAPRWLNNTAVYGIGGMLLVVIVGYFINHLRGMNEWFLPYVFSCCNVIITLIVTSSGATYYRHTRATFAVVKQLQEEEEEEKVFPSNVP